MKEHEIIIEGRKIGANFEPFIIAEMSGNHNQSLDRALEIVEAAAASGAHAIKIQTYTADTMTIDLKEGEFFIDDPKSLWYGKSLYELYELAHTPWEWHKPIFERARKLGLVPFSTPFDETAVDFLESLNVPVYKLASFENTDLNLVKKIASTGKPIIASTGMATESEIRDLVMTAKSAGCKDLILLKCTSTYPADPAESNILTIPDMRNKFDVLVGLSDHTLNVGVAVASVALGARVIEKHFTLSRASVGVDAAFSMEPLEFKTLVEETRRSWLSLGKVGYGPTKREVDSLKFRRSLYVVENVNEGEELTSKNIRAIRPGLGLPVKHYYDFIGKKAMRFVKRGTPLSWDIIK